MPKPFLFLKLSKSVIAFTAVFSRECKVIGVGSIKIRLSGLIKPLKSFVSLLFLFDEELVLGLLPKTTEMFEFEVCNSHLELKTK